MDNTINSVILTLERIEDYSEHAAALAADDLISMDNIVFLFERIDYLAREAAAELACMRNKEEEFSDD